MVVQREDGAALVAGASAPATDSQARVRVFRAFLWAGEVRAAGAVLAIPAREARQLAGWGKIEILPPEEPKPDAKPKAKAEVKEV